MERMPVPIMLPETAFLERRRVVLKLRKLPRLLEVDEPIEELLLLLSGPPLLTRTLQYYVVEKGLARLCGFAEGLACI